MTERPQTPISMSEEQDPALPLVSAYGRGGFTIQGRRWQGAILILRDGVRSLPVSEAEGLSPEDLAPLFAADPPIDLLVLGGGARLVQPPSPLRAALRDAGIVVEPMDSGAAARTFNVLLLEARRVAAVLMPL